MVVSTPDKILKASMLLFAKKGYNAVTTKEIAKWAGVCEMTVFRHFESKQNLFAKTFRRHLFCPKFQTLFESLEGNIEEDLIKISVTYQEALRRNQQIFLMLIKSEESNPEIDRLFQFPQELHALLSQYFLKMKEQRVITGHPEELAMTFLTANFGFFMTFLMMDKLTPKTDIQNCISNYIKIFTKGITTPGF